MMIRMFARCYGHVLTRLKVHHADGAGLVEELLFVGSHLLSSLT